MFHHCYAILGDPGALHLVLNQDITTIGAQCYLGDSLNC